MQMTPPTRADHSPRSPQTIQPGQAKPLLGLGAGTSAMGRLDHSCLQH